MLVCVYVARLRLTVVEIPNMNNFGDLQDPRPCKIYAQTFCGIFMATTGIASDESEFGSISHGAVSKLNREEKRTHHHRGNPPFLQGLRPLWCIPFPDLWCIPFSLVFPRRWYTP